MDEIIRTLTNYNIEMQISTDVVHDELVIVRFIKKKWPYYYEQWRKEIKFSRFEMMKMKIGWEVVLKRELDDFIEELRGENIGSYGKTFIL